VALAPAPEPPPELFSGGVLGRVGMLVAAAAGEVDSSVASSVTRSSSASEWSSAFASLLERAELWVHEPFLCVTQNLE
jgi:hypothetical protein